MTKPFALSLLTVALLLAGCSTQEPYQRPSLDVPDQFKEAAKLSTESGLWQPARNAGAASVPAQWWTLYGDVTRLARGVPIGSDLEYVDLGTIAHALVDRR